MRRCADGRVIPREGQRSSLSIDAEDGDGISALIAGIEESSRGVNVEAARVIAASPLFPAESKSACGADGKPRNGIVQPIGGVKEFAVGGDHDFGSEVGAHKTLGQAGEGLLPGHPSPVRVIVEHHNR